MSENQKKILQMLAEGKINVEEAQRLLALVNSEGEKENGTGNIEKKLKSIPRYMHVVVEPKPGQSHRDDSHDFHGKVNLRVPFGLIRAGIKLATLIPSDTADHMNKAFKDKGFNFDIRRLKEEDVEELVAALRDSEIHVDTDYETISVYAE
ncbi:MAG: hypothetical protein ABSG90_04050 [Dehalococcoidia bacterium]